MRAHELWAGEEVEMRKALVHIYEMQLEEYDLPRIRIRVRCSKGTYIRSLAHEIGQALESGAHLTSLLPDAQRRLQGRKRPQSR